ncbi:hypothetical protein [Novosphingobium rosa]|uniref:hypothetical protein n=1 Tax=Novosphingobium rosa TaxID=76978 RepID=UPI000833302C|nr:hypothetical protein [Novosphingobium rosa]
MEWVPVVFITFKAIILFTGMFFSIKWHYDQDKKKKNEAREQQALAEQAHEASDQAANSQ